MDLEYIKMELAKAGWKNIYPGHHMEIDFDLVGSRYFTLTKWNILVRRLPLLDQVAASIWQENFKKISRKSKSLIWGKCFLMCLIVDEVSPEVQYAIAGDTFGLFGLIRFRGAGGNIFIVDKKNKQIYGKVPALPYDVHKFSKSVREIFSSALGKAAEFDKSQQPPEPAEPHVTPVQTVPNYLLQAILVTLFCCLPSGIVAIVYAAQVNTKLKAGDYDGAVEASTKAKTWCWISFGVGLAIIIIAVLANLSQTLPF